MLVFTCGTIGDTLEERVAFGDLFAEKAHSGLAQLALGTVDPEPEAAGVQAAAHPELRAGVAALVGLYDLARRRRDCRCGTGHVFGHAWNVMMSSWRHHPFRGEAPA